VATLKAGGKTPNLAIFGIDNWRFNASHLQMRRLVRADDVARFVEMEGAGGWRRADGLVYRWYQPKDLVSFSVLRRSLGDLRRLGLAREPRGAELVRSLADQLVDERRIDGQRALRADGGLVYEMAYEARE